MLGSQRDKFDLEDVCYLNAAAWTPLPRAVQQAGHLGVARKGQPWKLDPGLAAQQHERARQAAARLIHAPAEDVALVSSVSYGVAVAGRLFAPPAGTRVLLLEEDHSSPSLEWMTRLPGQIEVVRRPAEGDWTAALLSAIERAGAAPVGLASISAVHWSDGGALDLPRVADALHAQGAALLIDATQAVGVIDVDVSRLDPDFVVFPTYKWVLGPYGRAFLYVAKRRQEGMPLEQTAAGRRGIGAERSPYMRDTGFVSGARRFDMGERDHLITLEMAAVGMEMVADWGVIAVQQRLRGLTDRLAAGLLELGMAVPEARFRAPNILSLHFPDGMPGGLIGRLEVEGVFVAGRLGRMRVSPHVYNEEVDVDRFVEVVKKELLF